MTYPKEIEKGREYTLFGEEFDHFEYFKRSDGKPGRRPIFRTASFCGKRARYDWRFDLGRDVTRCNACHRRIRRGYEFTSTQNPEEKLHFGRCCLINHVNIPDEELVTEAEE